MCEIYKKKFDKLSQYLSELKKLPGILAVTETKLKEGKV